MSRPIKARSQVNRSHPTRFLGFIIASILCTAAPARAELQFDVFIGYDGLVREASWTPFVCELKNDDAPIKGFIEIAPGNFGKGQTYQVPIELPTGTMKRITIPVFSPGRYVSTWNVRLTNERGKTIVEKPGERARRQVGWEIPLLGSLARTAAGAPSLRPILRDQAEAQPAAVRIQAAIFPDNPIVLEGLNAIYISSEVVPALRSSQANAILAWMNAGGHLIVGVEQVSDVTASPWLRSVLPVEPKDMKTISAHTEFQTWLKSPLDYQSQLIPQVGSQMVSPGIQRTTRSTRAVSEGMSPSAPFENLPDDVQFELADLQVVTGNLRDGRAVVTCAGVPVVVTADRGRGRVTALMFSPEREPFKSWKNLPTFWARLAEVPGLLYVSSDYYQGLAQSPDGIFGAMIDSRQIHKLPLGWLLLLLVVYLAVIGPFDQWWLKRIGKPMLTWITFPCYVALFSLLIYFIGYKLRAGESEYNELHLVDVLRAGDKAELRGRTYASIYSPNNAKFPLVGKQKYATLRGEFLGYGTEVAERGMIEQTGDNFKAEVFVPVWTSQLYLSDWWHSAAMPFEVTVRPTADGWSVIVKNTTTKTVKESHLVLENQLFRLGEIGAGATHTFPVTQDQGILISQFVQSNGGSSFARVVQRRQNAFGASKGGHLTDVPNAAIVASFLSQLRPDQGQGYNSFIQPPGLDLGQFVGRGGAVLLAWSPDERPTPPLNQFKPRRLSSSTLWRMPVSMPKAK